LKKRREAIGAGGEIIPIYNLPNNRIVDNQYKKIVDQKTNFLVGLSPLITAENQKYDDLLQNYLDDDFFRLLKMICIDCLNCGIAWVYSYYDEDGEFRLKRFAPYEVLPFWEDEEHTKLASVARLYSIWVYQKGTKKLVEKVEVYKPEGIEYYEFYNGQLIEDVQKPATSYYNIDDKAYNWGKIPLTPFKYNYLEIPLIRDLKLLQDALNKTLSDLQDDLQEDARNTILVLKNYDGQNLGEFRQNLSTYGAIKVRGDGCIYLVFFVSLPMKSVIVSVT
jgi:SPP1 family phage portal protein